MVAESHLMRGVAPLPQELSSWSRSSSELITCVRTLIGEVSRRLLTESFIKVTPKMSTTKHLYKPLLWISTLFLIDIL